EHIDAYGGARVGSAGRDPWSGIGSDIDKPGLGAGWLAGGVGRCRGEHTACGTNQSGGRTEQWKKLTTSDEKRRRVLILNEVFRHGDGPPYEGSHDSWWNFGDPGQQYYRRRR